MKKILILSTTLVLMASANITQQNANLYQQNMPQYNPYAQNYYGLSKPIMDKIQSSFPRAFIVDVDWEEFGYEIKLSNNMEMFFDRNGNFLGQKWDD
ncbi:PepSY-like domain-containing protein [Campylobacter sp. 1569]|uniref:PepSY-like domain-containing protein n=1 Tax=Campylobacter sp. 1569 TaxID=2735746 RepID=UPI00301D635B|nr:PepSY-like domain-containing protein [Campylobacter sp. 1569]